MYQMKIGNQLFPVTPGKVSMKIKNNNETMTLIDGGEVNLIKTPGLTEITVEELLLPNKQKYPFADYKDEKEENMAMQNAKYYLDKLEKWKKSKKAVAFKLTRGEPEQPLYTTSMQVTIESYEIIEDADQGFDVKVKLSMKEYRDWSAKKRETKKRATRTYVVKKGDTLMKIARRELNDGNKWKKIYDLNKKKLQKIVKKQGKETFSQSIRLHAGLKLKLPKK